VLPLPPYGPELDPVEHLWDELRKENFHNLAFDSLDAQENRLEFALNALETKHQTVGSIVRWPWVIKALLNWNWNYGGTCTRRSAPMLSAPQKTKPPKIRGFCFKFAHVNHGLAV
jgi:hypothetical protein